MLRPNLHGKLMTTNNILVASWYYSYTYLGKYTSTPNSECYKPISVKISSTSKRELSTLRIVQGT